MPGTKRVLRIVMPIVAIVCTIVFVPWDVIGLWLTPLADNVQQQINRAIPHGLDAMIVYVDKKGRAPELYAAGWKDREHKTPADPHALFKIASISKLYIAAATAKLVSKDSLALDKTLAEYLPELADRIENARQITLRMMLQHRSGIPDFIHDPKMPWSNLPSDPKALLKLVLDQPADFKPDRRYAYSNTNYLLVGNMLDKTLGYSHHQYIKAAILQPLGLKHTYALLQEADLNELLSGHYTKYDGDLKTQNYVAPGGSMIATAEDVGIFLRALKDGSLLNKQEQAIYSSVYGYEHTGLLPGYQSIARYHQDLDAVLVMFVNTNGGNSWTKMELVYHRIIKILRKQKMRK